MNYLKIYCRLVKKFEERNLTKNEGKKLFGYCEVHHIWMRSIYGQEKNGNTRKVVVSTREHYVLHAVLEKGYIQRYGLYHPHTKKATHAFVRMKNKNRYYNSRLFEEAYKRKVKQWCKPIRIYFIDGRVFNWYDGKEEFCRQNPQYNPKGLREMILNKRNIYKEIIKVEEIDRDNPQPIIFPENLNPKNNKIIPIRIYYNDGKVFDYENGIKSFCKENPEYNHSIITRLLRKKRTNSYKDIIKIDFINSQDVNKGIRKFSSVELYLPIQMHFKDGKILECREGISYFCKMNKKYNPVSLLRLLRNEALTHKDISKIKIIGEKIEFAPFMYYKKTNKIVKINISKIDYTRNT